jgi:hypothetical protein
MNEQSSRSHTIYATTGTCVSKPVQWTRHIDVIHDVFKERFLNASLRRHSYLGTILHATFSQHTLTHTHTVRRTVVESASTKLETNLSRQPTDLASRDHFNDAYAQYCHRYEYTHTWCAPKRPLGETASRTCRLRGSAFKRTAAVDISEPDERSSGGFVLPAD